MREKRLSGSEGGGACALPTPIFRLVPPGQDTLLRCRIILNAYGAQAAAPPSLLALVQIRAQLPAVASAKGSSASFLSLRECAVIRNLNQ